MFNIWQTHVEQSAVYSYTIPLTPSRSPHLSMADSQTRQQFDSDIRQSVYRKSPPIHQFGLKLSRLLQLLPQCSAHCTLSHLNRKQFTFTRGLFIYFVQHCFICRPFEFTVSEDAGVEPGMLRLGHCQSDALTTRLDLIHSARSHPHSARSHQHSARSHPHSAISHTHYPQFNCHISF